MIDDKSLVLQVIVASSGGYYFLLPIGYHFQFQCCCLQEARRTRIGVVINLGFSCPRHRLCLNKYLNSSLLLKLKQQLCCQNFRIFPGNQN